MAIGSAIERGSLICVYDEHGSTLFQKASGSGARDGLLGFDRLHRHRTVRFDHLHLRREWYDAVRKGGVTGRVIQAAISSEASRGSSVGQHLRRLALEDGQNLRGRRMGCHGRLVRHSVP